MVQRVALYSTVLFAWACTLCHVQSFAFSKSGTDGDELFGGTAVVDITPPLGYRMSGYFRERLNTGVLNPLHAKAMVLEQGGERIAYVACDLIGLSRDVTIRARTQASKKTGIPVENILISATHTHTGPLYFGALRDYFHAAAIRKHGYDPQEMVDYPEQLVSGIVAAIEKAAVIREPFELRGGKTHQEGLSFNRRFRMKDGSVRFNPGVLNPEIVEPVGRVDSEVGMIFLHRPHQVRPSAAIVNFALHLDTVGGTKYGADYPYYLEQSLRKDFGPDFTLFFGTGTCGDINHIDVSKRERLQTAYIGETLATTVKAAALHLGVHKEVALRARSAVVSVPLQQFAPSEVAWAKQAIKQVGTRQLPFLKQVEAYKILAVEARRSETIPLEVQVFRLGPDLAVVGLPGEVFVELGLKIKKASPFPTTLVIELCHDAPGYLPTLKAFREGSYETVNSRIAPGGAEKLVAKAVELLLAL